VVDRRIGRARLITRRVVHDDVLMDHLFVVKGDDVLVGLLGPFVVHAAVGHRLVDEGEGELFAVLIEQESVVEGWRRLERQRETTPVIGYSNS
jgi:hypothetical protein